ncbi:MAG TPA: amidohydrolase family protein [Acidimicrobiales bacterium]|nr:amidohydrolase family protein [Acidimicrobiales bacterium]
MHDLILRGGTLVDGTGAPPRRADVAVDGDRISAVGDLGGVAARREVDAEGLLVTPGFVDMHTHYDGQATWDPLLSPSCWHGVTTVVMGNCGVGFAPVRPGREEWLIQLMEGVEDIPGTALAEGIAWAWESFPEYLDALERTPRAVDVGAQVPHGAVRAYVMGERGARNEPATASDIEAMARIVQEGLEAGALGFSTSRTVVHRAVDGEPVPGTFAAEDELFGIGRALRSTGRGVFEVAPAGVMGEDLLAPEKEVAWMRRLSAEIGRPVTFALAQHNQAPEQWRDLLRLAEEATAEGAALRAQVMGRPTNLLVGWQTTTHPFRSRPTYRAIANLPLEERMVRLRDPEVKAAILAERGPDNPMARIVSAGLDRIFPMGEPPDYEPGPDRSVAAIAAAQRRPGEEVLYDLMMAHDGKELLMLALLGYSDGNLDAMREMLLHPNAALGLSDGGAHCGAICDASMPTFMLTHWARDRRRGATLDLGLVVRKMTLETARTYGLTDRGVVAPGAKADLNLIDFDNLALRLPKLVFDLPGGARRLVQEAVGYRATFVSGVQTMADGEDTGARPGRLVRGA